MENLTNGSFLRESSHDAMELTFAFKELVPTVDKALPKLSIYLSREERRQLKLIFPEPIYKYIEDDLKEVIRLIGIHLEDGRFGRVSGHSKTFEGWSYFTWYLNDDASWKAADAILPDGGVLDIRDFRSVASSPNMKTESLTESMHDLMELPTVLRSKVSRLKSAHAKYLDEEGFTLHLTKGEEFEPEGCGVLFQFPATAGDDGGLPELHDIYYLMEDLFGKPSDDMEADTNYIAYVWSVPESAYDYLFNKFGGRIHIAL